MTLDLHGTKHEHVNRMVDMFIWECIQNNIHQCKVITGNSEVMKQIVIGCVNDHGLTVNNFFNTGGELIIDLV